jgi:hypothetical protein
MRLFDFIIERSKIYWRFFMFRKTFLCSLACAVAISGSGSSAAAGGVAARVVSGTAGAVLTGNSVINFLQWFKIGTDGEDEGDENGVLGRSGAIGQFDHVTIQKGKYGSWKGLTTSIVKGALGLGGIVSSFLPF